LLFLGLNLFLTALKALVVVHQKAIPGIPTIRIRMLVRLYGTLKLLL